jgi:hypothetical protein
MAVALQMRAMPVPMAKNRMPFPRLSNAFALLTVVIPNFAGVRLGK